MLGFPRVLIRRHINNEVHTQKGNCPHLAKRIKPLHRKGSTLSQLASGLSRILDSILGTVSNRRREQGCPTWNVYMNRFCSSAHKASRLQRCRISFWLAPMLDPRYSISVPLYLPLSQCLPIGRPAERKISNHSSGVGAAFFSFTGRSLPWIHIPTTSLKN